MATPLPGSASIDTSGVVRWVVEYAETIPLWYAGWLSLVLIPPPPADQALSLP